MRKQLLAAVASPEFAALKPKGPSAMTETTLTPEQSESLHKAYLASMEITHMPQPVTPPTIDLAALDRAAAQGEWRNDHGTLWGDDGAGEFPLASSSPRSAAFIVALVNAYRAKQLVLIGPDAVEKVVEAMYQAEPEALYREAVRKSLARAALAALGVK